MHKVEIGDATLYLGDCLDVMPQTEPADCVFTSPPYADQRAYGGTYFAWKDAGRFLQSISRHERTQVFVNCGLVHRDGAPFIYWQELLSSPLLPWFGWYVWDQGFGLPGDWNGRLAPSFEFVFHLCAKPRTPNKTKPSVSVGRKITNGLTKKDGTSEAASGFGELVNPMRIPDSVIRTNREMRRDYAHPARFPVSLAAEFIAAYSDPGETICDPFMGSGTAGEAAARLGRKFIGIEIDPTYFDMACKRVEAAYAQHRLFA